MRSDREQHRAYLRGLHRVRQVIDNFAVLEQVLTGYPALMEGVDPSASAAFLLEVRRDIEALERVFLEPGSLADYLEGKRA
jgi:hypothetical protein